MIAFALKVFFLADNFEEAFLTTTLTLAVELAYMAVPLNVTFAVYFLGTKDFVGIFI